MKLSKSLEKLAARHEPENDDLYYSNDELMDHPAFTRHGVIRKFFNKRKSTQHNKNRKQLIEDLRSGKRKDVLKKLRIGIDPNEPLLQHPALQYIDVEDLGYRDLSNVAGFDGHVKQLYHLVQVGNCLGGAFSALRLEKLQKEVNAHNTKAKTLRALLEQGQRDKVLKMLETNDATAKPKNKTKFQKLV